MQTGQFLNVNLVNQNEFAVKCYPGVVDVTRVFHVEKQWTCLHKQPLQGSYLG